MELLDHPFLSFFNPDAGTKPVDGAVIRNVPSGEFIIHDGDESDCLFLILEGTAAIRKTDPDGKSLLIGYVYEGDFVGEFGLIDQAPRCADVVAATDMRVAAIPRDTVLDALRDPAALFRLVAHTVDRKRAANQRHVEDLIRQERMSLLGSMMNGILHDFRNPFAVISMASECIAQCSTEAHPYCEMISRQIERINNMAEDVLEFSRGETAIERNEVRVGDLFEQFRALYEEYFSQMGITLTIVPCDLVIDIDQDKLMRVLQNLSGNAARAMREHGGTVSLSARQDDDSIVIEMADNGPGIPEEVRHNLFDAFATSGKKEGIGIGLAVCKSIVEAHGGTLSFETEPGKGTSFHIRIPGSGATLL